MARHPWELTPKQAWMLQGVWKLSVSGVKCLFLGTSTASRQLTQGPAGCPPCLPPRPGTATRALAACGLGLALLFPPIPALSPLALPLAPTVFQPRTNIIMLPGITAQALARQVIAGEWLAGAASSAQMRACLMCGWLEAKEGTGAARAAPGHCYHRLPQLPCPPPLAPQPAPPPWPTGGKVVDVKSAFNGAFDLRNIGILFNDTNAASHFAGDVKLTILGVDAKAGGSLILPWRFRGWLGRSRPGACWQPPSIYGGAGASMHAPSSLQGSHCPPARASGVLRVGGHPSPTSLIHFLPWPCRHVAGRCVHAGQERHHPAGPR